jgi:methionine salvage enolase-phosphatase E1
MNMSNLSVIWESDYKEEQIHTFIYIHIHTYIHTHILNIHIYIYIYTYIGGPIYGYERFI